MQNDIFYDDDIFFSFHQDDVRYFKKVLSGPDDLWWWTSRPDKI